MNDKNFRDLPKLVEQAIDRRAGQLRVYKNPGFIPPWKEFISLIHKVLDYELEIPIWLVDMPFCFLNEGAHDHVLTIDRLKKVNKECRGCKYAEICAGPPLGLSADQKRDLIEPVKDLPKEVMIEVESKCNFDCYFCYNRNSFACNGRKENNLSRGYVKKIIDHLVDFGISIVRFTGGEPLLRHDIYDLMAYAKNKGLEVRLNTNASLANRDFAKSLQGILDNVLIPVESFSAEEEAKITNFQDSLPRKIKAIQYFYEAGIPVIRVGTVATKKHIENFQELSEFVLGLPINIWEFYRPISGVQANNTPSFDQKDVWDLTRDIIDAREKTYKDIIIANCLPFCAIPSPQILAFISSGALFDEGHSRMVVDPRGFVKPHYFVDRNIGDPLDLKAAWNEDFMVKMRKLEFLPEQCGDCLYKRKCAGGSRFEAEKVNGNKVALDPLSDPSNKIT